MKVLLNTTPLTVGGALQLGTALILQALRDPLGIDWSFVVSPEIAAQVERLHSEPIPQWEVLGPTPARSRATRTNLSALEARLQPDCIFTPYGPAYVQFVSPHLMGAANPWVAHADIYAYRTIGYPLKALQTFALSIYRGYWSRKAEMLTVETEYVRQGYSRRIGMPLSRIAVVPNTCGPLYLERAGERPHPPRGKRVRLLCFAAPHKHKRIEFVPYVAAALREKRPELDFEFVTTISPTDGVAIRMQQAAEQLKVTSHVNNLGNVPIAEGPDLYESCDICFLPTLMECFSATYPEAMTMGMPIVTTDLGFLRDVCKSAALYFPPNDASAAADRILELLDSPVLWNRLIQAGKVVVKDLPTASEKYQHYVQLLEQLYAESRSPQATAAV